MSKTRTDFAEGERYGRKIINELFHIVDHGKSEWKWIQTIDGVQREFLHFKSEKIMREKLREWDFYFQKQ